MTKENKMMNHNNAIKDIAALVANSEVSDAAAEKLLPIMYWLEAEQQKELDDGKCRNYRTLK